MIKTKQSIEEKLFVEGKDFEIKLTQLAGNHTGEDNGERKYDIIYDVLQNFEDNLFDKNNKPQNTLDVTESYIDKKIESEILKLSIAQTEEDRHDFEVYLEFINTIADYFKEFKNKVLAE